VENGFYVLGLRTEARLARQAAATLTLIRHSSMLTSACGTLEAAMAIPVRTRSNRRLRDMPLPIILRRPLVSTRSTQVVVVNDLADLDRIIRRGPAPSVPTGSKVRLALLPDGQPERKAWERSLSRYAGACGCQAAAFALMVVLGALIAAHFALGVTPTAAGLPVAAFWVLTCVVSVVLAKLVVLVVARRSLRRLGSVITAAANRAKAS
jgi:hypothetical protein